MHRLWATVSLAAVRICHGGDPTFQFPNRAKPNNRSSGHGRGYGKP
jgi:hypothetical protein